MAGDGPAAENTISERLLSVSGSGRTCFDRSGSFSDLACGKAEKRESSLCCIPVITIGASIIALYYVMLKLVKDEETTVTREFFHSFKQNFLQLLPVTVIFLVVVVLVADFHILGAAGRAQGASFMYGFCIVMGIICAAVFSYVFPLLARFENTVKKTFENGARLAASHIGQTLVITVVNLFPVLWFLISPQTFSAIFWIWVFVGGGVQAFVNSLFLVKIFDRLAEA